MKGRIVISVVSRRVNYRLELERKISVIKGNSGTGKSSLIRFISDYLEYGKKSGVKLTADPSVSIAILSNSSDWEKALSPSKNTVLFIDEDVSYLYNESFQRELWKADCYAVIVSRSGVFAGLPYSIFAIYEFITEKKGNNVATSMYRIYEETHDKNDFDIVLTEDSNSGYEMAKYAFENEGTKVISAGGNTLVPEMLIHIGRSFGNICVTVDGAAFGPFIELVLKYAEIRGKTLIAAPESFEYILLSFSDVKKHLSSDYSEIIRTYDFCEGTEYGTWEQYYEDLLVKVTSEYFGFRYSKRKLNSWFLNRKCAEQYISQICRSFISRR